MTRRWRCALIAVLTAGLAARIGLMLNTSGVLWDLESYGVVSDALSNAPLDVYGSVNGNAYRWPYPPAYFGWIAVARGLANVTQADFLDVIRLAPIVADLVLAFVIQQWLGARGASSRDRVLAAALVALGPIFIAVSSYHGQLDAVAILPGVLAVIVWQHPGLARRAVMAGALIGLGATLKTVPGLLVLALIPTARSYREAITVFLTAVAVPLLAFAPFLIVDATAVAHALSYRGVPGMGGLSLALQPDLAPGWLGVQSTTISSRSTALMNHGSVLTAAGLLLVALLLVRKRPRAEDAAVLVCLALYVFGGNFFLQYLVWIMPFLLLGGRWKVVALGQAALVPAVLIVYAHIGNQATVWLGYVLPILAVFVLSAAALFTGLSTKAVGPGWLRWRPT